MTPGIKVLIQDEAGELAGLWSADKVVWAGGRVKVMTHDRSLVPEAMAMKWWRLAGGSGNCPCRNSAAGWFVFRAVPDQRRRIIAHTRAAIYDLLRLIRTIWAQPLARRPSSAKAAREV